MYKHKLQLCRYKNESIYRKTEKNHQIFCVFFFFLLFYTYTKLLAYCILLFIAAKIER